MLTRRSLQTLSMLSRFVFFSLICFYFAVMVLSKLFSVIRRDGFALLFFLISEQSKGNGCHVVLMIG